MPRVSGERQASLIQDPLRATHFSWKLVAAPAFSSTANEGLSQQSGQHHLFSLANLVSVVPPPPVLHPLLSFPFRLIRFRKRSSQDAGASPGHEYVEPRHGGLSQSSAGPPEPERIKLTRSYLQTPAAVSGRPEGKPSCPTLLPPKCERSSPFPSRPLESRETGS